MIKKSLVILSISAFFFAEAQDVSVIRNTVDVYSSPVLSGSAKYNSMAGSMGALGGDLSTVNTNPAGIGVNIASEISATISINNSKNSSTLNGTSTDYSVNDTNLGNVGGVAVFQIDSSSPWKFVNVGVNFSTASLEDYSESRGNSSVGFDYPADNEVLNFAAHAYNRYGDLSKMSMAVGGNYDNRIYVGAGLHFHSVNLEQYDTAAFTSTLDNNIYEANKQYTPFAESSNGFSANVGVIGRVNNQFRVGAALETPTWWSIARTYNEYENPTDGIYSEDRRLTSPMKATLSAAFVPNKNLALNVDYTLGLSKPKYKEYNNGSAEQELNAFFADNYSGLSEVKIGAEYRIQAFRLRGGYSFAANPFDSMNLNSYGSSGAVSSTGYDNLFVGKRNIIGAGIGYDFKSFFIDAAYQNISAEYSSPFLQGSAQYNTGYFGDYHIVDSSASLVSDVKNTRDNFFITLGWKF